MFQIVLHGFQYQQHFIQNRSCFFLFLTIFFYSFVERINKIFRYIYTLVDFYIACVFVFLNGNNKVSEYRIYLFLLKFGKPPYLKQMIMKIWQISKPDAVESDVKCITFLWYTCDTFVSTFCQNFYNLNVEYWKEYVP